MHTLHLSTIYIIYAAVKHTPLCATASCPSTDTKSTANKTSALSPFKYTGRFTVLLSPLRVSVLRQLSWDVPRETDRPSLSVKPPALFQSAPSSFSPMKSASALAGNEGISPSTLNASASLSWLRATDRDNCSSDQPFL